MHNYCGIDPGKLGGLAIITEQGTVLDVIKMPETPAELVQWLKAADVTRAALERVRSSPQQGVVSAFTFGRGYGWLEAALLALDIPVEDVTPQRWQKEMGCMSGGDKSVTRFAAQKMFPLARATNATADALLIAEWLRRREGGSIKHDAADKRSPSNRPAKGRVPVRVYRVAKAGRGKAPRVRLNNPR